MSENNRDDTGKPPSEELSKRPEDSTPLAAGAMPDGTVWQNIRWFMLRAGALFGAFFLLVLLMTGVSGWYTSRPEFCRSCHNMEPYYVSWEHSSHSNVTCIKCHFEPGVGEKVRGKLNGLVQLAKYVTETAGPRPVAEISDASCLRSGCHETRMLAGRVDFHGVPFDHTPHLEPLRRGKKLRCTSCHSQIVQGTHMTVTTSTCFLCHFKGEHFNEGLAACTRCHQIPAKEFDLGGGTTFNHDLAYERGVECRNCHGDLIRGKGEVPRERCGVCHNREDDLKQINDHVFMHQKHVTDHKVDCLDCHLMIHHSHDPQKGRHAADDCASCHTGQHIEQVNMLHGTGGKTLVAQEGGMTVARVTCLSCHRIKTVSPAGTVLMRGATDTCAQCHEGPSNERLKLEHDKLATLLEEIDAEIDRARSSLAAAEIPEDQSAKLAETLNDIEHDVDFLRQGNGIHNVHYATSLGRKMVEQLLQVCRELKIDEPKITLPGKSEELK